MPCNEEKKEVTNRQHLGNITATSSSTTTIDITKLKPNIKLCGYNKSDFSMYYQ